MTRSLLLLLLLLVCGPAEAATEEAYDAAASRVLREYIKPSLARLKTAADRLEPAAKVYCTALSPASQDALRTVFQDLLAQWARVDFLRFGPVAADQRLERFAFWPDSSGAGARQLRRLLAKRDPAYLEPRRLGAASAAIQGLPAFEALMFPTPPAPPDGYSCNLAMAIAANLARLAAEMGEGWDGPGALGINPRERANELLKALLTGFVQLRDQRLLPALGKDLASARPERLPYRRSGGTDGYILATVTALADFTRTLDLPALAGPDTAWASGSVSFEFENVLNGLRQAGSPLSSTIATAKGRAAIERALAAIKGLQDLIGVRLAPATGLSVGFNALDGD